MFISARQRFREGDANWAKYISWIGLKNIQEIRSLDRQVNRLLPRTDMCDCILNDYRTALRRLPRVDADTEYYQLAVNLSYEKTPTWLDAAIFLGCDLADDCWRSGVFNYGPWTGDMHKLALHLNQYGLLKFADARTAVQLMGTQWERAYSRTTLSIWGLYELTDGLTLHSAAESDTLHGQSRDIPID